MFMEMKCFGKTNLFLNISGSSGNMRFHRRQGCTVSTYLKRLIVKIKVSTELDSEDGSLWYVLGIPMEIKGFPEHAYGE